jgi:succinyl-CoA synthetase alpha subunit
MRVVSDVLDSTGVEDADAVMGTTANRDRLREAGTLNGDQLTDVEPDDLVLVAAASSLDEAKAAVDEMRKRLARSESESQPTETAVAPKSVRRARRQDPYIDLAFVSVPGQYAGRAAWNALAEDLHVHLFSDNVPIDVERDLKEAANLKDRLLMGPDCGTAILDGIPLGFANEVPDGPVGLVSASGTGLQAVSSRLARRGLGVSQAVGTGGRDLSAEIEGLTTRTALTRLDEDESTDVIVLLSKPPAESAVAAVSETIADCSTPVVVHFQGADASSTPAGTTAGETLAATADEAISVGDLDAESLPNGGEASRMDAPMAGDGRWIRGLFTGGTLCGEAALLVAGEGAPVRSNIGIEDALEDLFDTDAHTFVDFGTDEFTEGRPHPMIDPSLRDDHLRTALKDDETAVVLLDIVLGYGAHDDPAGSVTDAVNEVDADTPVVASIVGTDADPQCRTEQVETLESAGVVVTQSNADAARLASRTVSRTAAEVNEGSS